MMEGDVKKALPTELLIIIDIPINNPRNTPKVTLNNTPLLVYGKHFRFGTLRMRISVNPDYLKPKYKTITVKLPEDISQRKPEGIQVEVMIGLVTSLSEDEVFEKSVLSTCSDERAVILAEQSGVTEGEVQVDQIDGEIIGFPVRGKECQHLQVGSSPTFFP
ncbi:hypothetical protein H4Q26_014012 [Puccinia striiformis f. sp. tritici PST-130]|nr:hypothetical protein H4Q26_014012 [Puccinia striiformis f. sp. tritici PST-130]